MECRIIQLLRLKIQNNKIFCKRIILYSHTSIRQTQWDLNAIDIQLAYFDSVCLTHIHINKV